MRDEFGCSVSKGTKLEAYIGRRDDDVLIELAITNPIDGTASVCLPHDEVRELAATLANLVERVEKHLAKDS